MISVVVVSKDEPFLDETLRVIEQQRSTPDVPQDVEVLVVDASDGRLDHVRRRHPDVSWIDFAVESGVGAVTIPHQRNLGVRTARGDVIVFTDAGCVPQPGWLRRITGAVLDGEQLVTGGVRSIRPSFRFYETSADGPRYVEECSTINLAFRREVFDDLAGFDESFRYGSDVDFSWRARDCGYLIRREPDAEVLVDWGDRRRQLRRAHLYGRARVRLYRKHPNRTRDILRRDPVVVLWPLFILGLPVAVRRPSYLLLLVVPAWRNRRLGPARVIADHLAYGLGVLAELARAGA